MKKLLPFVLLIAVNTAFAEGFFIGGDASLVAYPLWDNKIWDTMVGYGYTPNTSTEVSGGIGAGIHGGQWLNDNFGWELGYDHLGHASGDFSYWDSTFTYFDYSWQAHARATHVVVLGAAKFGRNKIFGKAGLYRATTTVELTSSSPGPSSRQWSNNNTGLLVGGGYSFAFTDHLLGNAGLTLFNDVKFADLPSANMSNTRTENLVKIAVGLDYLF